MLKVRGDHVTIAVTDPERARKFYSGFLGLKEIPNPNFNNPVIWFDAERFQIHCLIEPEWSPTDANRRMPDGRTTHLAFGISSYGEAKVRLIEAGYTFQDMPNANVGLKQLFFEDPDGNVIELIERR